MDNLLSPPSDPVQRLLWARRVLRLWSLLEHGRLPQLQELKALAQETLADRLLSEFDKSPLLQELQPKRRRKPPRALTRRKKRSAPDPAKS